MNHRNVVYPMKVLLSIKLDEILGIRVLVLGNRGLLSKLLQWHTKMAIGCYTFSERRNFLLSKNI